MLMMMIINPDKPMTKSLCVPDPAKSAFTVSHAEWSCARLQFYRESMLPG